MHYVRFHNISRSDCLLSGYPHVIATEPGRPDRDGADGSFFPAGHSANLHPGAVADLGLETDISCEEHPDGATVPELYHHVRIALPGGGEIRLAATGEYVLDLSCGLHLRPFATPDYPLPHIVLPLESLRATVKLPRTVHPGSALTFVVDLHNPTGHAVSLDPCPSYVEAISTSRESKAAYALNCATVHVIGAGQTVRYAMRLNVPADTPLGRARLFWSLIEGAQGPNTTSVLIA